MKALDLNPIRQAIAPYLLAIKAGIVLVLVIASFIGGCQHGEASQAAKVARLQGNIAALNVALSGAADALDKVNKEAARRVAQAKQDQVNADRARAAADTAAANLKKQLNDINQRLERASRKPACKALLDQNVDQVCDL